MSFISKLLRAAGVSIALGGVGGCADQPRSAANPMIPDAAKALHEKGREAGRRGDLPEAVTLFSQAAELAPQWPYPLYDRAFAHLQAGNTAAAVADYDRTLELSPRGFFTAHVAVDTLRREQNGELPAGLYLAYLSLESMPEAQKRQVIPQLTEKYPQFAPAWLDFAALAATPRERLARIEAGLRAQPDPETNGMLRLNQAETLRQLGQDVVAARIVREVAADPSSTSAVEGWAKALLAKTDG